MAKSKLVAANKKIAETLTNSFGSIEKAVTSTYTKIEDAFVDQYLTKDGESIQDAKARLKKENEERRH